MLEAGHDEPYFHFDEIDSPSFLVPAVRQYLAASAPNHNPTEDTPCPALSR